MIPEDARVIEWDDIEGQMYYLAYRTKRGGKWLVFNKPEYTDEDLRVLFYLGEDDGAWPNYRILASFSQQKETEKT